MATSIPLRRRSRMSRKPLGKHLEITARDIAVFKLLRRYRYLRSTFIHGFVGGASETRFKERLGDLFHEGYLDRPEQQWRFANCRHVPVVYELGSGACRVLADSVNDGDRPVTFLGKDSHRQFQHSLMICEILSSIEFSTRCNPALRFVPWPEIEMRAPLSTRSCGRPYQLPAVGQLGHAPAPRNGVIPDAVFGLEYSLIDRKTYRFFAVEADRATMPADRRTKGQSSFFEKLIAYDDIIKRQTFRSHWAIPNLLVLTVTRSEQHLATLIGAVKRADVNPAFFIFSSERSFGSHERASELNYELLRLPWSRAALPSICIGETSLGSACL